MEECSVLIETTKLAEDKTSRWFDLPIDYELFRDLLGVEADSNDYQITDMKLPFAGDIVRFLIRSQSLCFLFRFCLVFVIFRCK